MNANKNMDDLLGLSQYIIEKISRCKTIGQLNYMRKEVVQQATSYDDKMFYKIQNAFIKKQKSLKRIPLIKRPDNWENLEDVDGKNI